MSEERSSSSTAANPNLAAPSPASDVLPMFDRFLKQMSADVGKVFGAPTQSGDSIVIPAAEGLSALGFGTGYGSGTGKEGEGSGGGGGGGGYSLSRPVAVIVVSPGGVEVKPVVDVTKIAMAGLTAFGFVLATWFRMTRPPRK